MYYIFSGLYHCMMKYRKELHAHCCGGGAETYANKLEYGRRKNGKADKIGGDVRTFACDLSHTDNPFDVYHA